MSTDNDPSAMKSRPLTGLNILLAEDDVLIAIDSQDALLDSGAAAVHVANTLEEALKLAGSIVIDVAIIDVHLGKDSGVSVARVLAKAGVPFIFATGYSEGPCLPTSAAKVPIVSKPYQVTELIAALCTVLHKHSVL
jgi:DNA-binding response OmpR family regulator